jgi:ribonuclease P protein subunit RPR2
MTRIAGERIHRLFALAEAEARRRASGLPNRYVALARRIGTRYNVRVPAEYRELYCRRCSIYWVEGRTVRTRLRAGRRSRTCLGCGSVVRRVLAPPELSAASPGGTPPTPAAPSEPQLAFDEVEEETRAELEDGEEGE